MAKMSKQEIKAAISSQAPGYTLAEPVAAQDAVSAEADIVVAAREDLAAKYRGDASDDEEPAAELSDDEIIVPLETRAEDGTVIRRAAVLSTESGELRSIQG
jgi:hypothetical protein